MADQVIAYRFHSIQFLIILVELFGGSITVGLNFTEAVFGPRGYLSHQLTGRRKFLSAVTVFKFDQDFTLNIFRATLYGAGSIKRWSELANLPGIAGSSGLTYFTG